MALVGVRRSWLAVIAVLGLVGSLLAVGVVPAAAVDGKADNEAVYSACVGTALESLGLVDVVGSFAEDAVNCLGHYGITKGRTATTYDPGAPVLRWQMALFLTRATGPAGVSLLADPADVFTDLEGVSDEIRSAINQMAGLGIMSGRSGGRFSPDTAVSRAEMASMLDAFLVKARPGKGAFGGEAGVDELGDVTPDATGFNDIGSVTRGQYSAIERMFELGVTRGTSDNQFSPGGLVTRAQMAAFITRMLAHTVARPAGLTMQASALSVAGTADSLGDVDLVVSVRDSIHMAMADESVDVFSAANAGDAFGSDGRCSADEVLRLGDGTGVCEIEVSDGQTDSDGDVEITGQFGASATVWAWAGDVGDRFDADDTVSASLEITVTKPATKLRITDDMATNATAAQFGDRVTFTIQVVDDDGNPVATKDVSVTVAANTTVKSGAAGADEQTSGATNTRKTDDSGRIELSYRQTDPRTSGSDHGGDRAWLDLDISYAGTDLMLEDKTTLKKAVEADDAMVENAAVVWRDGTPVATTLTLAQAVEYHESSGTGSGASNTVTATLVDQYGDPVSRQTVEFASDDAKGIGAKAASGNTPVSLAYYNAALLTRGGGETPKSLEDVDPNRGLQGTARLTRTTNRRGVASLTYNRDSSGGGIETITARVKADLAVPLAQARSTVAAHLHEDKWDARSGDIMAERIYHYWGVEPGDGDSLQGRLLVADTDNNKLVLAGDNSVFIVGYDSNDHLNGTSGAVTLSGFETDLKDNAKHVSVSGYDDNAKGVSSITAMGEWTRLFPYTAAQETADNLLQRFGSAFAADGNVIVVGAPRYQSGMGSANRRVGRVYVYDGAADDDPAILSGPTAGSSYFGDQVDISGDTIVVGSHTGSAYVFVKPTGGWADDSTPDLTLTPTNIGNVGKQVAIDGGTIVVAGTGGVAVYERTGSPLAWPATPTATLERTDTWADRGGGARVLDVDEDSGLIVTGTNWANVTVDGETTEAAGHATLFVKPDSGWADVPAATGAGVRLTAPTPREDGSFGAGVAVANDTVVVGAFGGGNNRVVFDKDDPDKAHEASQPGRVYVFTKPDGGPWADNTAPVATLTAARDGSYGTFGFFVAISSDGNTIAASDHYQGEGDWRGSVRVFTEPDGGWEDSSESTQYVGPAPGQRFSWGTNINKATGDILAALRQERTGATTDAIDTGECKSGSVTVGTTTVSVPEHCLRYLPVYIIDR